MTSPTPSRRQRLAQTRLYRSLLRRLTPDLLAVTGTASSDRRFANIPLTGRVVVYFPDDVSKVYQLDQWLPVLAELHARHPVLVVTRNLGTFRALQDLTGLPLIFTRRLRDLNAALQSADPAVCLYVNNSATNFQVLGWPRALHLHLNHGESDKISMASNQAKAYDQVLVAGPAAVQRYLDNLLALDAGKLVQVGRPQLDLQFGDVLPRSSRATVLYTPTWEGETPAMDYSSLSRFGPDLVEQLMSGGFRVVYRPHPKVLTGTVQIRAAHDAVLALLAAQEPLPPGDESAAALTAPVLSLFPGADLLISDVSSVALDWLYLCTDRPLWIADARGDRDGLVHASPLAGRTDVLGADDLADLAPRLKESLAVDERAADRTGARAYYFADLQPGESTRRFLETVDAAVERRDALLNERRRDHHDFELEASAS